jgi:PAS domain-containing protein
MTDLVEQLTHILNTVGDLSPTRAQLDRQYTDILVAWETARIKHQWYASLFHDGPTPLLVTDQWGIIHEANQATAAFFNRPPDWLMRKPLAVFVPLQERYDFRVLIHRLVYGECVPEWEGHLHPRGRPPLPVALAAIVLPPPHALMPRLLWRVRENLHRSRSCMSLPVQPVLRPS